MKKNPLVGSTIGLEFQRKTKNASINHFKCNLLNPSTYMQLQYQFPSVYVHIGQKEKKTS